MAQDPHKLQTGPMRLSAVLTGITSAPMQYSAKSLQDIPAQCAKCPAVPERAGLRACVCLFSLGKYDCSEISSEYTA